LEWGCFTTPQLFQRGRNWGKTEWEAGFPRWWGMGGIGKKIITQHCVIFYTRKSVQGQEPAKKDGEPGLKVTPLPLPIQEVD